MHAGYDMFLLVIRAANLLNVDELEVFKLAHRFWYHRAADLNSISTAFDNYLRKKTAPPWVVHFSRTVIRTHDRGHFDPVMFGIYPEYEKLPWSWSLAFQTPRYVPLNKRDVVFVA
jgi:hypothetical protein